MCRVAAQHGSQIETEVNKNKNMATTRRNKSLAAKIGIKEKMTREQMQLALAKKKVCDAKALEIVVKLSEPQVDPQWLVENLQNINRCHMEDIIEERAITKVCGYVLCQKPLTVVIKQRYHISLRDNKVYDVTQRKNFCSSNCFGASNYLLEQMLTSPLWARDKEEIPKFRIFSKDTFKTKNRHGEELDITLVQPCTQNESEDETEIGSSMKKDSSNRNDNKEQIRGTPSEDILGNIEDFVHETIRNMKVNDSNDSLEISTYVNNSKSNTKLNNQDKRENVEQVYFLSRDKNKTNDLCTETYNNLESTEKSKNNISNENEYSSDEDDAIEQTVYPLEEENNDESSIKEEICLTNIDNIENTETVENCDKKLQNNKNKTVKNLKDNAVKEKIVEKVCTEVSKNVTSKSPKHEKLKSSKIKKPERKSNVDENLVSRIEQSFQEWIGEDSKNFLFGDKSVKQKTIEKIERQDKYSILCEKLNRLQFEDEQEDAEILEKPTLKPAPHFAVLKEEGEKLQLKVNAFYQGKFTFQEPQNPVVEKSSEDEDSNTFLPLTEAHAPQNLRRKIFLEKLDQVVPELLKTLAGNNEIYAGISHNYTSVRCTVVKALIHTFALSPKNIIFKTAEWTLVGLVIIKMLSLLDPLLANFLNTKQANMYISMILTSYKLDPDYLSLLVASFSPNVNPVQRNM